MKEENGNTNGPEKGIDSDMWFEYFQKLNSVKSKYNDRFDILNQMLTNSNQPRTFTLLDTVVKYLPLANTYRLTQHSSSHMTRYIEINFASQIASFALDLLHCMFVVCMLS